MQTRLRSIVVAHVAALALVAVTTATAAETPVLLGQTSAKVEDIAIDASGNVYAAVGSGSIKEIQKVTPAGTVSTFAGSLADYPGQIAVGSGGAVFAGAGTNGFGGILKFGASGSTDATYPIANASSQRVASRAIAVDATGSVWWIGDGSSKTVGKVPAGTASGTAPTPVTITETPCAIAVDAAGDVYVATADSKVYKYAGAGFSSSSTPSATYNVGDADNQCALAVGTTHVYFAYSVVGMTSKTVVDRLVVGGTAVDAEWATLATSQSGQPPRPGDAALGSDGVLYVLTATLGFSPTSTISKVSTSGAVSILATAAWLPGGLALDAATNVYVGRSDSTAGVYKIAQAAPTPTPDPNPTPEPGPPAKTSSIPSEIRVESAATPTVKVPCEAADGELLAECTVQITAPRSVLAGVGGGIEVTNARAATRVTLGKATVKATTPRKRITVTVRLNANGKKALSRNVRVSGLIDLTAVTQAATESTGSKAVKLQLPRQVMAPTKGIFDTLSTALNADGVAFVKRLAEVLPKRPKRIVCTGYADATGVPGDNRWLGEQRARTLCDALAARGIKARSTALVSRGADDPRAPNTTPAGRAENRRATITITY